MLAQAVVYQEHELRAERLIMVPWAREPFFFVLHQLSPLYVKTATGTRESFELFGVECAIKFCFFFRSLPRHTVLVRFA